MCVLLCGGDITRRDRILWEYPLEECKPWLKYQERQVLFREAIIHLLVGETAGEKKARTEDAYCRACKAAKKDHDCNSCSRDIRIAGKKEDG